MFHTSDQLSPHAAPDRPAAAELYMSLELSPSKWLVTSLLSGNGRISKHILRGGDGAALLRLIAGLKAKAQRQAGPTVSIVAIQEAGLDGFSLHRLLEGEGIESWVVDPASVAVSRRMRRAKSDGIDGETLLRTLLAFRRGEPRVCSMVRHRVSRRRIGGASRVSGRGCCGSGSSTPTVSRVCS